jgi:hypothetical protein
MCKFHQIAEGSITVGCDNISALHLSLDLQTELELKTNMPDNDILAVILHILKGLPISWTSTHV